MSIDHDVPPGPVAGLDALAPDEALVAALEHASPALLAGEDLAAYVRGSARVLNRSTARLLEGLHHLGRAQQGRTERLGVIDEFSADELCGVLGWSRQMAARKLDLADDLAVRLPEVADQVWEGRLEESKARALAEWTRDLAEDHAHQVCAVVLPDAPEIPVGEVISRIEAIARALDPKWWERRRARALKNGRVILSPNPSGTATYSAVDIAAPTGLAMRDRVDALAAAIRALGVRLPVAELRVQVFARLLDGSLAGYDDHHVALTLAADYHATTNPDPDTDTDGGGSPADDASPAEEPRPDGPHDSGTDDADPDDGPDGGGPDDGPDDSGPDDSGPDDSGPDDSGPDDSGPDDDGPGDAGPGDSDPGHPDDDPGGPDSSDPGSGGPGSGGPDDRGPDNGGPGDGGPGAPGDDPGSGGSDDAPRGGGGPAGGGPDPEPDAGDRSPGELDAAPTEPPGSPDPDMIVGSDPGPGRRRDGTSELRLRLTTALGLDQYPGHVPGYGTLGAPDARTLMMRHLRGEWRVVLTTDDGHLQHVLLARRRPERRPHHRPHRPRDHTDRSRGAPCTAIVELQVPTTLLAALNPDDHGPWAPLLTELQHRLAEACLGPGFGQAPDAHDHGGFWRRHPRAEVDRWTRVRDRHCVAPCCRRPAHTAELDHTLDWALGGPTSSWNLGVWDRHHHRAKHQAGWRVSQPRPGRFLITTRAGVRHHTEPRPVTAPLPAHRPPPAPRPLPDDGPGAPGEDPDWRERYLARTTPKTKPSPATRAKHPPMTDPDDDPPPF